MDVRKERGHCTGRGGPCLLSTPPALCGVLALSPGAGTYLGVVATNVCKKLVNEPAHQGSGCVDPCNELGYNLACRKT